MQRVFGIWRFGVYAKNMLQIYPDVGFYGNMMCLSYHSEIQLQEVYAAGFETDMEQRIADISKWLKKEYKRITGDAVTLTKEGEIDVRVENSSRVRSWVTA